MAKQPTLSPESVRLQAKMLDVHVNVVQTGEKARWWAVSRDALANTSVRKPYVDAYGDAASVEKGWARVSEAITTAFGRH